MKGADSSILSAAGDGFVEGLSDKGQEEIESNVSDEIKEKINEERKKQVGVFVARFFCQVT